MITLFHFEMFLKPGKSPRTSHESHPRKEAARRPLARCRSDPHLARNAHAQLQPPTGIFLFIYIHIYLRPDCSFARFNLLLYITKIYYSDVKQYYWKVSYKSVQQFLSEDPRCLIIYKLTILKTMILHQFISKIS